MKKWKILNVSQKSIPDSIGDKSQKLEHEDIIKIILENRGLRTKKETEEFLNPKLEDVTIENIGIDKKQLKKAIIRIQKAIQDKEKIVVFGDYDVDGICGTAILWETLHALGADVIPYIPHRIEEGYGLSIKGIQNIILNLFQNLHQNKNEMPKQVRHDNNKGLIITVDNGIVANKAVEFASKEGIDVVITDHHVPSKKLPNAFAIVHTTNLCGAGVAWMLAQEFNSVISNEVRDPNRFTQEQGIPRFARNDNLQDGHLELVALATVADLVPLIGANRTFLKFGLQQLRKTQRIGLKALFQEAGIEHDKLGVYEIGHIIAPRLNAMGRLDYAMDSLRLLCTNNKERAKVLAQTLGSTNRERQELTLATVNNSKFKIQNSKLQFKNKNLLFIADKSYQQGIIGLVAGKLVEEFYKPSIVVSIGEKYSKASARSVSGFNIIEFIRTASEILVDAGGHPMAAGFTVETSKLSILQKTLEEKAEELLDEEMLKRTLRIDCNLPLDLVDNDLYDAIQKLSPFGMGNPEPTFVSRKVVIEDIRIIGRDGKHLKLRLGKHALELSNRHSGEQSDSRISKQTERFWASQNDKVFDAIAFGMGERAREFHVGDKADVAYTIDEDRWNGNRKLQLKIKDMRNSS